ncbi:acyl-CoA dehydrogenase [Halopseudomonas sabulinigri]|uniref:Acyl-CoA dehydrogenase n=1 Tax=Halopseudomonas sabulinigri TaxID=472181 RepID=A0A1H1VWA7_9GAMM|nr:acyl-CoA dehydrogenase family protein [Halopseudomonas sabulinigri]SDS89023.1 acyl-CoA dehydrogenase [Halopseudomonas sabulinigri]
MRELFESTIERLLSDLCTPDLVHEAESGEWPAALWRALEDNGFPLAGAPEVAGGADASWADLYVIIRALGRFAAPVPLAEMIIGNWLLEQAGLGARSDILSLASETSLTIGEGRVSGELAQVPWGRFADSVVALAGDNAGQTHVVLLDVATAERVRQGTNIAGEARDHLSFSAAAVAMSAVLPTHLADDVLLAAGAMARSAQIAGAINALLEMTASYAGERKQFGKPIAAFQAIQQQLAVLAEQAAAANVAAEAAFAGADQRLPMFSVAAAKVSASEAASQAAAIGHSVHGAIGFTQEYALHTLTRRLWSWRSEFGSSTFWSKALGEHVCAAGSADFWPMLTNPELQDLSTTQ